MVVKRIIIKYGPSANNPCDSSVVTFWLCSAEPSQPSRVEGPDECERERERERKKEREREREREGGREGVREGERERERERER